MYHKIRCDREFWKFFGFECELNEATVCVWVICWVGRLAANGEPATQALSGLVRALTVPLSHSPRQLIIYYLWYFADVAAYLLKK